MLKIQLNKPVKNTKGEEIKELAFDFSAINGNMMINAEKSARTMGDQTLDIIYSMNYQLILASKVAKVSFNVLKDLPGNQINQIVTNLKLFLLSTEGVKSEE